jgi:hypothetical protein
MKLEKYFSEKMYRQEELPLLPMMSKGEKEKYQKKKIRSMKTGEETPNRDIVFH